jgi:hypothetical protein
VTCIPNIVLSSMIATAVVEQPIWVYLPPPPQRVVVDGDAEISSRNTHYPSIHLHTSDPESKICVCDVRTPYRASSRPSEE